MASSALSQLAHPIDLARRILRPASPNRDQALTILEKMKRDNAQGPNFCQPGGNSGSTGRGWDMLSQKMETLIRNEGVYDVEEQQFNQWFAGPALTSPANYFNYCYMIYRLVKQMDRWRVLECFRSDQPSSGREVILDGHNFSSDTLMALYQVLSIAEFDESILTENRIILDLGGGWGRIGYVITRINPKAIYIHCDIPISSVLAQFHLPQKAPEAPVFLYEESREMNLSSRKEILDHPGIHFIGSHDLVRFDDKCFDFFLNIASFQEMPNDVVEAYFSQISRTLSGLFYMKQYALPNRKDGFIPSGESYYPFPNSWEKLFLAESKISYQYFESLYKVPLH